MRNYWMRPFPAFLFPGETGKMTWADSRLFFGTVQENAVSMLILRTMASYQRFSYQLHLAAAGGTKVRGPQGWGFPALGRRPRVGLLH